MKEVDNVKFYDVADICEMIKNYLSKEEIRNYFEESKIKGKKIDNKWHADKEALELFLEELAKEKVFLIDTQKINLTNIKLEGRILDIGGGGEGVIGQFKGEQVIAIDPNKKELEEAPYSGALTILMDAKELKFLDNTFDTATSFFTMMYIPVIDHKTVFQEIHRVLKLNGEFVLWDVNIPNRNNKERDLFGLNLEVKISDKIINTGYATLWNKEQDMQYFSNLAKSIGFEILEQKVENEIFYLRFMKK